MISFSSSLPGADELAKLISETTGLDWTWSHYHLRICHKISLSSLDVLRDWGQVLHPAGKSPDLHDQAHSLIPLDGLHSPNRNNSPLECPFQCQKRAFKPWKRHPHRSFSRNIKHFTWPDPRRTEHMLKNHRFNLLASCK
jgi:hypothetical protein